MAKEYSLSVIIKAVDKATMPIRKIGHAFKRLGAPIGAMAKRVKDATKKILLTMTGLVIGLGYTIKKFTGMADVIGKTADRIGLTTTELQKLRFAAEQSGLEISMIDTSLEQFSRRIGEAKTGTGEAYDSFVRLKIGLKDQNGEWKTMRQLLDEVADKTASMSDETARADILYGLFGRSGVKITNMLKDGSKGLEKFGNKLVARGAIIPEYIIRRSEKFNDTLNLLKKTLQALVYDVIGPLLPTLTKWADKLSILIAQNKELIKTKIYEYFKKTKEIFDKLNIKELLSDIKIFAKILPKALISIANSLEKIVNLIDKIGGIKELFNISNALDWYKEQFRKAFSFGPITGPGTERKGPNLFKDLAGVPANPMVFPFRSSPMKSETDINIKVMAESGTSAKIDNIKKIKGDSKVNVISKSYLGPMPLGYIPL